jgi:hypothetical protein
MDCRELKEKAPSCFEPLGVVVTQQGALPNYAQIYFCLWELSRMFNTTFIEVLQDEALFDRVLMCRHQLPN